MNNVRQYFIGFCLIPEADINTCNASVELFTSCNKTFLFLVEIYQFVGEAFCGHFTVGKLAVPMELLSFCDELVNTQQDARCHA